MQESCTFESSSPRSSKPNEKSSCLSAMAVPRDVVYEVFNHLPVKSIIRFQVLDRETKDSVQDPYFHETHFKRFCKRSLLIQGLDKIQEIQGIQEEDEENQEAILKQEQEEEDTRDSDEEEEEEDEEEEDEEEEDEEEEDGTLFRVDLDKLQVAVAVPSPRPNGFRVIGHSHGIVCVAEDGGLLSLWNPSTRQFQTLPSASIRSDVYTVQYCFGFDSTHEECKVVKMNVIQFVREEGNVMFKVVPQLYGNGSWKTVNKAAIMPLVLKENGVFVENSGHWIPRKKSSPFMRRRQRILSFNMVEEKFSVIGVSSIPTSFMSLCDLHGCLGVVAYYPEGTDLWVMKDYKRSDSWVKLFSLNHCFENLSPLCYVNNGKEILLEKDNNSLILYRIGEDEDGNRSIEEGDQVVLGVKYVPVNGLPGRLIATVIEETLWPVEVQPAAPVAEPPAPN